MELGVTSQLKTSDPQLRAQDCNLPGIIEFGMEYDTCPMGAKSCALLIHHDSYLDCGKPFNDNEEVYQDGAGFKMKWGGK